MQPIPTQRMKNRKSMKSYLRNDGFTLIEMLFSLGLFSLLTMFMTSVLVNTTEWHLYDINTHSRLEWNIFIRQLDLEVQTTGDFEVPKNNILLLNDREEKITYEIYNNMVRRRVDGTGHEVALQNIKRFLVSKENETLTISVMFLNGDQYEKRISKRYNFDPV